MTKLWISSHYSIHNTVFLTLCLHFFSNIWLCFLNNAFSLSICWSLALLCNKCCPIIDASDGDLLCVGCCHVLYNNRALPWPSEMSQCMTSAATLYPLLGLSFTDRSQEKLRGCKLPERNMRMSHVPLRGRHLLSPFHDKSSYNILREKTITV